jgi:formamidopyrimidine-DNA glycosylase
MLELPEAVNLATQLTKTVMNKKIQNVLAGFSPHKFAWYAGDPADYDARLKGKSINNAAAFGGMVELAAGDARLVFGDGANIRYHAKGAKRPEKHQLLMELEDGAALSASIQMYGGLWCINDSVWDNPIYSVAKEKPSPLQEEFDQAYFSRIIDAPETQKLNIKALLATEQRIPGLGNGVLQDILFNAGINPKRKVESLSQTEKTKLFKSIKTTLKEMAEQGGRDTEKDLFGQPGGYKTRLSALTVNGSCPACGGIITKQAYMGGSVYFCGNCQKLG